MSRFGWAYVNCDDIRHTNVDGVTGSVMFLTGNNSMSGSNYFMYNYNGSVPGAGGTTSSLILTGTFFISGAISASSYHFEDITRIDSSGSTRFGNTNDDNHFRTGSLIVGKAAGSVILDADVDNVAISLYGGVKHKYTNVSGAAGVIKYQSSSISDYLIGVKGQCPVEIRLHSASGSAGYSTTGSIIVIKDEFTGERMPIDGVPGAIILSGTDGETIDGEPYYEMTGTMTAISVYSNGSNWFVF